MPELPEVETIKRILAPQITGQSIVSTEMRNAQVIAYPSPDIFASMVCRKTITGMSRREKYLAVHLTGGDRIIIHLRMTGQLLVTPTDYPEEKHTHLILNLSGGKQIRYIDVRRFGCFWCLSSGEYNEIAGMDKLGIEPTDDRLTASYLKSVLGNRKTPIKEMLHDQSIIAGIGNIYSDEILYAAGIYPGRRCVDMKYNDWQCLAEQIPAVIRWGIEANHMTPEEYLAGKGKEYRNMPFLKAYGHEGQACSKCGTLFKRIRLGGRSSTYCPVCQKECL